MGTNKRADLILAVEDPFTNIVRLEQHTWGTHIVLRHPEMSEATEEALRELLRSPDRIHEMKNERDKDIAGFDNGTYRALVMYDTVDFAKGETFGRVTTVYPDTGLPSTWGDIIWERKSGTNK